MSLEFAFVFDGKFEYSAEKGLHRRSLIAAR